MLVTFVLLLSANQTFILRKTRGVQGRPSATVTGSGLWNDRTDADSLWWQFKLNQETCVGTESYRDTHLFYPDLREIYLDHGNLCRPYG